VFLEIFLDKKKIEKWGFIVQNIGDPTFQSLKMVDGRTTDNTSSNLFLT
jgi:hypothetical protein